MRCMWCQLSLLFFIQFVGMLVVRYFRKVDIFMSNLLFISSCNLV